MQSLSNVPDAHFVLDVERRDALAIFVPEPRRLQAVRHEAVTAGVHGDDFRDCQRTFHHGLQLVAHVHVFPVALLSPARLLCRVDGVDALVIFVGVIGWLDVGVLALAAGFLAFGFYAQNTVHADDLTALINVDVAAHADDGTIRKFRLLFFHGFFAAVAEDPVARSQMLIPVPRAARDEYVHATEQTLGSLLDFLGHGVAQHGSLHVTYQGAVGDLGAPARCGPVGFVGVQRIVVTHALGPVADSV